MSNPRAALTIPGLANVLIALGVFVVGVVLAIWATERLLDGLVGISYAAHLPTFAIGALLSGFEAENVAVGLAAGVSGASQVALGTVFGGAIFLVCVALGVAAVIYPLRVRLPRGALVTLALAPVVAGVALIADETPRVAGIVLLVAFGAAMAYVVVASRRHRFVDDDEIEEALERKHSLLTALGLTVVGIVVIGFGGELVASGATQIVLTLGVPIALMGMVVAPAAVELEEIVRQAIPTREGHPEVSAGNLVGTLLYFVLFNLGLIALLTPVHVDPLVRTLDWPALVGTTWLATLFLARGRVGRIEGAVLLAAYAAYVIAHLLVK
jgi:cation:H+ antiporter